MTTSFATSFGRFSKAGLLAILALAGSTVFGGTITLHTINGYTVNPGGVFVATSSTLDFNHYASGATYSVGGTQGFGTFCLEYNEYITPGQQYNYTIAPFAASGGIGGATNGKDLISQGTAWLYSQFASGTLTGFNYSDKNHYGLLQQTFWYLEDEVSSIGNHFLTNLLKSEFGTLGNAKADDGGLYGVSVLNLTDKNGTAKQSQLYFHGVPDAGATVLLFGLGLVSLMVARRKLVR